MAGLVLPGQINKFRVGGGTEKLRSAVQELVERANRAESHSDIYRRKLSEANSYVERLESAYEKLLKHNSDLQAKALSDHSVLSDLRSRVLNANKVLASLKQDMHLANDNNEQGQSSFFKIKWIFVLSKFPE